MVKNLSKVIFSDYGTVLSERQRNQVPTVKGKYSEEIIRISTSTPHINRIQASITYLEVIDGCAVLAVSQSPDPDSMEYFYFDKPVLLKRGTYFSFLGSSAAVRCIYRGEHWKAQQDCVLMPEYRYTGNTLVTSVYTVFYQEKEPGFFFKGEQHTIMEMVYVDKGRMHSIVDGQNVVLSAGDLTIYGPDQWHGQYADADCAVNFITIAFDMESPYLSQLLNQKFFLNNYCRSLMEQILEESRHSDVFSNDFILSNLRLIILTLLRATLRGDETILSFYSVRNQNRILDGVLEYISQNIYEKLSVDIIARENHISPSYLTGLFRTNMNISPAQYMRRAKLEESRALIRQGQLTVTEIAQRLKYSSVNQFSRQFKANYNMTPSQYINSLQTFSFQYDTGERRQNEKAHSAAMQSEP